MDNAVIRTHEATELSDILGSPHRVYAVIVNGTTADGTRYQFGLIEDFEAEPGKGDDDRFLVWKPEGTTCDLPPLVYEMRRGDGRGDFFYVAVDEEAYKDESRVLGEKDRLQQALGSYVTNELTLAGLACTFRGNGAKCLEADVPQAMVPTFRQPSVKVSLLQGMASALKLTITNVQYQTLVPYTAEQKAE